MIFYFLKGGLSMKGSKVGQKLPKGITHIKGGLYMGRFQYKSERFIFYGRDLKKLKKELSYKRYGMYKQAFKNEMIRRNPVACTTIPRKTEIKKFRVLSLREQELFSDISKGSVYYRVYQAALGTGMRVGELKALEWRDINFENRIIHVSGTLKYRNGNGYYKDTPKTRSSVRDIPMLDSVYKCLKEQKRQQLENGIPPKVMQELLGHTSITMTLDIYSHVLPNTRTEEIQKIANLF